MGCREEILQIFSKNIRLVLGQVSVDFGQVQEIRLRVQAPLLMICGNQEYYITSQGGLSTQDRDAYRVSARELKETLEYMGRYSLYAFEEEMRQGFLTIPGGHRIGLAGKVVCDGGGIRTMKYISSVNVRLAHQVRGCGDPVLPWLYDQGRFCHTLILSPPRCGKTTLLRDLVRQISDGSRDRPGMTVGVVDERSEIAACYQGIPQNDLGIRTDVLDCCPKAQGIWMLIRTMSPQVIAADEIGSREEMEALEYVMNCGCRIMATIHGTSVEDVRRKPALARLVSQQWFERYVVLGPAGQAGRRIAVYDGREAKLYETGGG